MNSWALAAFAAAVAVLERWAPRRRDAVSSFAICCFALARSWRNLVTALRKSTVTAIDDRRPEQGNIQFSNFSLLENRETHTLELYLTTYGQEPDPNDWATADNYRYTLRLVKLSSK